MQKTTYSVPSVASLVAVVRLSSRDLEKWKEVPGVLAGLLEQIQWLPEKKEFS